MCVIAISKKGIRQPSLEQIRTMFKNNPDGAGYMYARDERVHIHKGFMSLEDFERSLKAEHFTENDSVVYHFRIATQGGVNPEMTHPFPLTDNINLCEKLDLTCPVGLAHNGVIRMTSFAKETRFSDTAYFISWYMSKLIRTGKDITDPYVNDMIDCLTNSKWAIMDGLTGDVITVGSFKNEDGLLFSNGSYREKTKAKKPPFSLDDCSDYYGFLNY